MSFLHDSKNPKSSEKQRATPRTHLPKPSLIWTYLVGKSEQSVVRLFMIVTPLFWCEQSHIIETLMGLIRRWWPRPCWRYHAINRVRTWLLFPNSQSLNSKTHLVLSILKKDCGPVHNHLWSHHRNGKLWHSQFESILWIPAPPPPHPFLLTQKIGDWQWERKARLEGDGQGKPPMGSQKDS